MEIGWILVLVVVVSAAVAAVAFNAGDRRRREGSGAGPRPRASIGEALQQASREGPAARVLVVFLGEDRASAALDEALAEDPALRSALERPGLHLAVVRGDAEVRDHLHAKYAGAPAPAGAPSCLVLAADGALLTAEAPPAADPGAWLAAWIARQTAS